VVNATGTGLLYLRKDAFFSAEDTSETGKGYERRTSFSALTDASLYAAPFAPGRWYFGVENTEATAIDLSLVVDYTPPPAPTEEPTTEAPDQTTDDAVHYLPSLFLVAISAMFVSFF